MEIRKWAIEILSAATIEGKLKDPGVVTDHNPGPAIIWKEPVRPPGMGFSWRSREEKLPPFQEHGNPDKRAICLHRFGGHELLAVEIMAYVLLAFPQAPSHFRKGVANTLREEQTHVHLYMDRMAQLGIQFGDLPLYRHFWMHTPYIRSPLHYICMMSLTFEMANLDFATMYGKSFRHFEDHASADLMDTILRDEITHVGFGRHWLGKMKAKDQSDWTAWTETLSSTSLTPKRAKGFLLHEEPRKKAGVSLEWLAHLKTL